MHTVFALLCFVVVIHWLIFPYPSGLLHWHCGNLTIAPVLAKQPWWIWINTSCECIMNDCITTTKQSTTKLYAYFLGYTVTHLLCYRRIESPKHGYVSGGRNDGRSNRPTDRRKDSALTAEPNHVSSTNYDANLRCEHFTLQRMQCRSAFMYIKMPLSIIIEESV